MPQDVTTLLTQFTLRYRTALLVRVLVLGGLGLLLIASAAWRLAPLPLAALWRIGLPVAAGAAGLGVLGFWARRRWPSQRASAAYLDRVLGLKQRLVTAEEFSRLPNPPTLYPTLLEDVIRRATSPRAAYPRAMDRTTFILALLLMLLLLWPFGGRSPLTQLAQLVKPTPPPDPSAPPPPNQPPPPPQQQQQQSQSQQPSPQSSSGGQDQSPSGDRNSASSQSAGGENQSQQTAGAGSSSSQGGQQGASSGGQKGGGQDAGSTDQSAGAKRGQQQSGKGAEGKSGSEAGQARGNAQQSGQAGGSGTEGGDQSSSQGASGQQKQSGGQQQDSQAAGQQSEQAGGEAGAQGSAGGRTQPSNSQTSEQPGSGAGAMSTQAQQALQQDIQKLLKDVSGELQQLQDKLEAQDQPPPTPGSSTDPELYGGAEAANAPSGERSVPIQLKTDAAGAGGSRKSGGSGRASGEAAAASPTAKAEPAQLSDDPVEESAGSRDTVPPEYQDVFDQLNRSPGSQSTAR